MDEQDEPDGDRPVGAGGLEEFMRRFEEAEAEDALVELLGTPEDELVAAITERSEFDDPPSWMINAGYDLLRSVLDRPELSVGLVWLLSEQLGTERSAEIVSGMVERARALWEDS